MHQTPKTPRKITQYHGNKPLYYRCTELAARLSNGLPGGIEHAFAFFIKHKPVYKLMMVKET